MVGAIARHPGVTAFAIGTVALGTANALAPKNDLVAAANTASFVGGAGLVIFGQSNAVSVVGGALMGASLIGHLIRTQSD